MLIDGSAGWAVEGLKNTGNYPSAGLSSKTRNTTYSSSICVNVNGDSDVEMWVLVHNQGIAYYKHEDNSGAPSTPDTPPVDPGESYSKGLTMIWQNTTSVPGTATGGDVRFAAVSNGTLIANDKGNKKIIEITESGYSDYYDPSKDLKSYYDQELATLISADDTGNILVNAGGLRKPESGTAFMVISADLSKTYKLDLSDIGYTAAEVHQTGRVRGNMLSAEGGYFTILPNNEKQAVVVKVANGALAGSELVTTGLTNTTSFIAQPAYETVSEMASNMDKSFILRNRVAPGSVYTWASSNASAMDKGYEFTSADGGLTTANAAVEGFDWFKLGGKSYFIMPMTTDGTTATRGSYFAIFDQDGNAVATWTEGQKTGLGTAYGSFIAVPNDEYSVYIYHFVPGVVAEKLRFAIKDVITGIESVEAEVEAPVEYYNLQGVKVANPDKGLYIKKQGKKVTKVIL